MFGGVYGNFETDLRGNPPSVVDFYNNQIAPAAIIGGHMDLNRSARWVFRITPDAVITHYGINYPPNINQWTSTSPSPSGWSTSSGKSGSTIHQGRRGVKTLLNKLSPTGAHGSKETGCQPPVLQFI